MGETVCPVGRDGPDVRHGDDIVAEVERSAVIAYGDREVGQVAVELCSVEAALSRQNLAHGHQLAGVVGSIAHERNQVLGSFDAGGSWTRYQCVWESVCWP